MAINLVVDGEIILYGDVGIEDFWGVDGFMARDVVGALAQFRGKPVTIRLNSGGGVADEGVAIYNSIASHDGEVTMIIDGCACSAASFIMCAGDKVIMRTGSYAMIHDPMNVVIGNAADMEAERASLEVMAEGHVAIYAAKTKQPAAVLRQMMRDQTFLSPERCKELGFCDEISPEPADQVAEFDYTEYQNAPAALKSLATAQNWKAKRATVLARKKEIEMSGTNNPSPNPNPQPAPNPQPSPQPAPSPTPTDPGNNGTDAIASERARVAQIMQLCDQHQAPSALAQSLIISGASIAAATARIALAGDIRKAVATAHKIAPAISLTEADAFIAAGTPLLEVQNKLFEKMSAVAATTQIDTTLGSSGADNLQPIAAQGIDKLWGKVTADTQKSLAYGSAVRSN